jgi:hypothetical protein
LAFPLILCIEHMFVCYEALPPSAVTKITSAGRFLKPLAWELGAICFRPALASIQPLLEHDPVHPGAEVVLRDRDASLLVRLSKEREP